MKIPMPSTDVVTRPKIPQIVAAASNGLGKPNASAVNTASPYYDATQKQRYKYDPARVKQLLKQAGYHGQPILIDANKRGSVPSYPVAVMARRRDRPRW